MASAQREHGNLIFCFCDRQGGFGGARARDRYSNLGNFLRDKLLGDLSPLFGKGTRTCYQLQLLVQSDNPLSPAEEDEARSFFNQVRSVVWRASFGGEGGAQ